MQNNFLIKIQVKSNYIYRTKYMDIGVGATISTETRCIESDINRHVLKRKLLVIPLKSLTGCVTLQSR